MATSPLIQQAKSQIQKVKGESLSVEERQKEAVSLAALMLEEAQRIQTSAEKKQQEQLAGMMRDPVGKVFTTAITDQCFRSHDTSRVANQLVYVINKYGVPAYLPLDRRIALEAFRKFGQFFSFVSVPLTVQMIRNETSTVILPGEEKQLVKHMAKRRAEGVRVNLNHLGEAILGEEEACTRLKIYLDDLAKPEVEYISVKISTIYSQINLLAWDETLKALAERLRELYRAAAKNLYVRPDGKKVQKFVNLDMEEYRDLHITEALFRKVLDEPEFQHHAAGIVLQSYLPDSYRFQKELTEWAMKRVIKGGAPIKIRIVKGANLAMEEAAKRSIPVIVLDRPNPINGLTIDGPMMEEKWRSFVGYINVPYCHGMTIGELAYFFNAEYKVGCKLTVIPMKGWKRSMSFADTGLTWMPTSPHIPEAETAFYYPTTGLLGELQMVSTGIGYTLPFKVIGAPWIDASLFAAKLNEQKYPGVYFLPFHYRPFFGRFELQNCQGVLIVVTDPKIYLPVTTQYLLIGILKSLYPQQFAKALKDSASRQEMFNKVNGTAEVYRIIKEEKYAAWQLRELHQSERIAFRLKRQKYLISTYQ